MDVWVIGGGVVCGNVYRMDALIICDYGECQWRKSGVSDDDVAFHLQVLLLIA